MAKRRRQDSSRASWLATNSSNGIGRLRVHNPPGERKSGIPHSLKMPAPVKGTIVEAAAIMSPSCSTPLRRSFAITSDYLGIKMAGRGNYSTASRVFAVALERGGRRSRCLRDRFLAAPSPLAAILCVAVLHLSALGRPCGRGRGARFFRRVAVLRQFFYFGCKLGLPRRNFFRQFFDHPVAQCDEFLDAK